MKTLRISKNAHEIRWPTATASWNRYEDEGLDNMQWVFIGAVHAYGSL